MASFWEEGASFGSGDQEVDVEVILDDTVNEENENYHSSYEDNLYEDQEASGDEYDDQSTLQEEYDEENYEQHQSYQVEDPEEYSL